MHTDLVPVEQVLPSLLRSSNDKYVLLAGAYARDRIFSAGWDWVRSLSLDKWDARDAAALLSQAGLDPEAWSFAESLGEDVFREYWNTVPAYNRPDQQQLEFACQRLLEAGRPEIAIGRFSRVALGKATVSPSIVMDALSTACQKLGQSQLVPRPGDDLLGTIQEVKRQQNEVMENLW